jgi:hypothetical protein
MESTATDEHSVSSFDDFLEEAGYRDEVENAADERVLAWQIKQQMAQVEHRF